MELPMRKTKGFKLVAFLWIMNSLLRVIFGIISMTEVSLLEQPVSPLVHQFLTAAFLFLGVMGFITSFGLWKRKLWGIQSVIGVSLITIAFDIWGLTIQFTAALGFIVPVIALIFLVPKIRKTEMTSIGV